MRSPGNKNPAGARSICEQLRAIEYFYVYYELTSKFKGYFMKNYLALLFIALSISGCSSGHNEIASNPHESQSQKEHLKKLDIEEKMRHQNEVDAASYRSTAKATGCGEQSINYSKQMFTMAEKYYGSSKNTRFVSPESWAIVAERACVSGYEAGRSGLPRSSLEEYLYGVSSTIDNPFEYQAVAASMYWGYGLTVK